MLVLVFMLVYYQLSGINAVVALLFNLLILLGLMSYIGATMTLPGIAGFVLTMGIGVDSNVLIFERIKEELAAQRGVRQALDAGFSRVFLTLLDTHVASLISAAFLFQFGTGPIRGFATTLSIGLLSNLFTATFVSQDDLRAGPVRPKGPEAQHLADDGCHHADFPQPQLQLRPVALARADPVVDRHRGRPRRRSSPGGLPLGVEFSGGTIVIVKFDTAPSVEQVRDALGRHQGITAGQNIVVQRYGDAAARQVLVRLPRRRRRSRARA